MVNTALAVRDASRTGRLGPALVRPVGSTLPAKS
jgi:hypothetical protein